MKNTIILGLLLSMMSVQDSFAQFPLLPVYYDPLTMLAAMGASSAAGKLQSKKIKAGADYALILGVSSAEIDGVVDLGAPQIWVDFGLYTTLCDDYKSPGNKKRCNARKDYLEESYTVVLDLLSIRTNQKIRKGLQEQIWEKYASLCNMILKDLDRMKVEQFDTSILDALKYKK